MLTHSAESFEATDQSSFGDPLLLVRLALIAVCHVWA